MYNSSNSFIVPAKSRESIRKDVYEIRKRLDLLRNPYFPIMEFVETLLPSIDPDFSLDVVKDEEMGGILAEACPDAHIIRVKETVYIGACQGHYWHRMTMAHELGHYLYHSPSQIRLARLAPGAKISPLCNSEVQADIFAAELLIPINLVKSLSYREIARKCGVSFSAAQSQLKVLDKLNNKRKKPDYKK